MCIGILVSMIGGLRESRGVAIAGGLITFLGVVIVLIAVVGRVGVFSDLSKTIDLPDGRTLLYGSYSDIYGTYSWSVGLGTILPLISAPLTIVGGISMRSNLQKAIKEN